MSNACSRWYDRSFPGRPREPAATPNLTSEASISQGFRRLAQGLARAAVVAVTVPAAFLSLAAKTPLAGAWWLELMQYAPYPLVLLPALAAFMASFLLARAWRLAAALALVLVLTGVMGLALGRADSGSGRVRVMTYNIKAYLVEQNLGGYARLAWEVALHNPDILVMQDAGPLSDMRHEKPDTASAVFAGREVYAYGQYIVVSRFPLQDCQPGDISFDGKSHSYVRCTVKAHGAEIDLFTAHLLSPREGLNATRYERADGIGEWQHNLNSRLIQASKLAADVSQRKRPLIVAGDLNAPESSPVVQVLLERGLRDAFSAAGLGYGYTHGHSLRPHISFLRIDHILVSPELGVIDCFVGGKEASEHRPVIADLAVVRDRR